MQYGHDIAATASLISPSVNSPRGIDGHGGMHY